MFGRWDIGIIIFIATEDIKLLIILLHPVNLRENIVASLNSISQGILAHGSLLIGCVVGSEIALNATYRGGIAHISIIEIATHNPVVAVECEIQCTYCHHTFYIIILLFSLIFSCRIIFVTLKVVGEGIVHRLTIIATHSDAHSGNGVVIHTGGKAIFVGHLKLRRRTGTVLHPVLTIELKGIKSGYHLQLIAEIARTSPKTKSCVMPCRRKDSALTLGAINGEEVERFVVGIEQTYGYNDMSHPHVKLLAEGLLNPELFEFHLATFLNLLFPLATLREFLLLSASRTGMFKLDLRRHKPSLTEVVTQIDNGMRDVKPSVTRVVGILLRVAIAIYIVAIKIARKSYLTIASHTKSATLASLCDTI